MEPDAPERLSTMMVAKGVKFDQLFPLLEMG
jgi:hypothetical protein